MKKNKINYFNKINQLLGNNKKTVIICLLLISISAVFSLAGSVFSAYYGINKALVSKDIKLIIFAAGIIGVLSLTSLIFFHITYRKSLKYTKKQSDDLRQKVFKKAIYLDVNYFTTHSTGGMINTIIYDVATFSEGMAGNLENIVNLGVKIILSFIILTIINPKLSIVLWIMAPVLFIFAFFIYRKIGKFYNKRRAITKQRLSHINEGIMGVKTVKSLNIEDKQHGIFKKYNKKHVGIGMKISAINEIFWRVFDIFTYVALAILFLQSYELSISYGELFLYYQLFKTTLYSVAHLAMEFDKFTEVGVSAGKIYNLLSYEPLVKDKENAIEKTDRLSGNISFNDVTFTYPNGETVLKNFSLKIEEGKKFAIVGKTGSGKSTIANLIYRYYEPSSGKILFGDIDYTDLKLEYIHKEIGFILQEPMLFDDTIFENLRYGKLDATEEEVKMAAKLVGADEFIKKLADGYHTKIGESGILLSTGQKQQLAFARVVLKNPSIIILDEATANIDSETENIIQKNIDKLFRGKTCIFIAHRLSTIKNSDKIVYLENGEIVESGSHDELLAKKGKYADLYNNQFVQEKINKEIN